MNLSADQQHLLLDVARDAIRSALSVATAAPLPDGPEFEQPAGCFVSLHETHSHRLRGCVGRLDAKDALARTVATMARSVLEDPRFLDDPVTPAELAVLEIELSILSPLVTTQSPLDFDLAADGIYLTCGDRSGCFLPQVARDTGWSKRQLLERLCIEKLGLPALAWRHPTAQLYRFTALLVGPEPFDGRV